MDADVNQHEFHDGTDLDVGAAIFVLALREKGIRNTPVLRAMEQVPRELFAPQRFRDLSRTDVALPLPCGQTMTGPTTIALMLSALDVQPGHSVLEVGTGSGYVSALLAQMGAKVTTVERYEQLSESAQERIKISGHEQYISLEVGDGLATRLRGTKYDRILLNGSGLAIPQTMTNLLSDGAKLVGALTLEGFPRLVKIVKQEKGTLHQELGAPLRLSPLVNKDTISS
ncbi:protein-L-isoaspartate O-methyltransferase [Microvirga sp. W0021]|uniref:Protein-L-isoaspartate O-methyltransferase n=1 Tax=Hohaiivirga grylli TaxID=3133970 RepID=A0ABV0BIU3_9HYPH